MEGYHEGESLSEAGETRLATLLKWPNVDR